MQDLKDFYKINSETKPASDLPTYVEAGIHENIELKEVKKGVSKNGNPFLAFYFENEKGDKLSYTEWPLSFRKEVKDMNEEEQIKAVKRVGYQMSRLKQLVDPFKPNCVLEAENFDKLTDGIISFLGDSFKGKKVKIKAVYDDKGYVTLDSNPNNTFIAAMNDETAKAKIRPLPGDRFERPAKPDSENKEENPVVGLTTEPSSNEDKLPF